MLGLERALELLGLDDGVDAELAGVAVVGVLQGAFATLEEPARAAVQVAAGGGEDELDGDVAGAFVHERDERFGEGVFVVARGLDRKDEGRALLEPDHTL